MTLFPRLLHLRKVRQNKTLEIYEAGKSVEDVKVVLFRNADDVERCKLEEEVRMLDRRIKRIQKELDPWEKEMRQKHRKLWNY